MSVIGASLSKLHTGVTALLTGVCMLVGLFGPATYYKFKTTTFEYFSKIDIIESQWRATVRVQHQQPGVKTTEVETRIAACVYVFLQAISAADYNRQTSWQTTYVQTVCTVGEVASGKGHAHKNYAPEI